MTGKFYGVGVGPGDPELLTIKAVKILKKADIVVSPITKNNKKSVAFEIAKNYLSEDIEFLNLLFPMTYNQDELDKKWFENAQIISKEVADGKNVVFLTLGDPMLYSTYMYLLPHLNKLNIKAETICGVNSFSMLAARTNIPLVAGDEKLAIVPLRRNCEDLDDILDKFDNIIVMKPSHDNKLLAQKLEERGLTKNFLLISKCGMDEENISYDIEDLKKDELPYLSTVIIKKRGILHE